jgi:hypothetical protein
MAIWLYRQARGAIREHQAKKAVPITEDSHLVPETQLPQSQHKRYYSDNGIELDSQRASHSMMDHSKENAQAKEEAHRRNIQQWKLLIGLVLPNFLAAVDVTIVAPAIPLISSDFSQSISIRLFSLTSTDHLQTACQAVSTGSSPPTR